MNGTLRPRAASPSRVHTLYALLVPLVSMSVVSLAAAPASAADPHGHPMPEAQAFDGGKPLPSIKEVTDLCSLGKGCRFAVDAEQEYRGGVISVGNAFLNCTDHPIDVSRRVSLRPSIQDNIGGEISGRATRTGTIDGSSEVNLSGSAEGSERISLRHEAYAPKNFEQATQENDESDTQGRLRGEISGSNTGTQSSNQQFEKEGNRSYGRTWENSVESAMSIQATAPAGDVLTWGYVDMGHRIKGTLKAVGTSKYIKNVVVDEPSIVESSSFVTQTYTAPKGACLDTRPTRETGPEEFPAPLRARKPEVRSVFRSMRK
ncbi:hypothetical protein ACFV2N_41530 [Streptomyces sp. NPDC059680]|uniref:hypothetical protein n=1 Tax=Streptomyces sp. NPDC059680 TaxID=3346904 RepID=UPI0036BECCE5